MKYAIHWFRRDLRLAGNPALWNAIRKYDGNVLGFFCFDPVFLGRPDFSVNRFQFFLESLAELKHELRSAGSDLLCWDLGPRESYSKLLEQLSRTGKKFPAAVTFNRDYEPFAVARDRGMTEFFQSHQIAVETSRDHLLIEPHEIFKGSDPAASFQIYTPYQRRWLEAFVTPEVASRVAEQKSGLRFLEENRTQNGRLFSLSWETLLGGRSDLNDKLDEYRDRNRKQVTVRIPPAGSQAALRRLKEFGKSLEDYAEARDIPGVRGTSGFSIYFKNGSLTVAQVIAGLNLSAFAKGDKSSRARFLGELIWREFFYSILARYPYVEKEAFQRRFNRLKWTNRPEWISAWKEGRTGYPIVDAGMRQLKATGWMHNRVRMIVASFLTKDLLVDWKIGERYFMECLLDGDLAPNNGGWQWAASTGCDAQPYFRIFNPELQSRKFDPKGVYLRKYLPELASLGDEDIHAPSPGLLKGSYPAPIVSHKTQRSAALSLYAQAAKGDNG